MFDFLCLFGPGAATWMIKRKVLRDGHKERRFQILIEILAYSVVNTFLTVAFLKPMDRVQITRSANGMPAVHYGTSALVLSLILSIVLGILSARADTRKIRNIKQSRIAITAVAVATAAYVLLLYAVAPKGSVRVSDRTVMIDNEIYASMTPVYVDDDGEYYISARALAEGLDRQFSSGIVNLFQTEYHIGDDSFRMDHFFSDEDHFFQGRELFISLSYLSGDNMPDINVRDNDDLADGSDRQDIYIDDYLQKFDYDWTKNAYIAHAFGGIDDTAYTNSLEAFRSNYEAGHRVFEVDLRLTSDDDMAAIHDMPRNAAGDIMSAEEFKDYKFNDKYTSLLFEDVVYLMQEYPDIYIVTDTKELEVPNIKKQFQFMVDTAERIAPGTLKRIIPQIYHYEMYDAIMDIYDWDSVIFTLYALENFSPDEVAAFAYKEGIQVITTPIYRAQEDFLHALFERDIKVYVHTFNTDEEFDALKSRGVTGVYTDFLTPDADDR